MSAVGFDAGIGAAALALRSARDRWPGRLGLTLAAGLLAILAWPAVGGLGWLAWVAFVPWLLALARVGVWEGAGLGALFGLLYSAPGKWDTVFNAVRNAGLPDGVESAATALVFVTAILPFALVGCLLPAWRRLRPPDADPVPPGPTAAALTLAVMALPELLPFTPAILITGQPLMVQVADLGGMSLVCFVLLLGNGLLAQLVRRRQPAAMGRTLVLWALLMAGLAGYGHYRLAEYRALEADGAGTSLGVLAVQTDMPRNARDRVLLRDHPGLQVSAVELTRGGLDRDPGCEVVAWPESPRTKHDERELDRVCSLAPRYAASFGRPLLLDCVARPDPERTFFEARLLSAAGERLGIHRKARLVPFYEYQPAVPGWSDGSSSEAAPGNGATVFALEDGRTLLPVICYEIHSPDLIREGVRRGGQTIVHMASFAAFGRSDQISVWDLAMARMRAIEVRRPIVRVTNRGHAGLILASGEMPPDGVSPPFARSAQCHWSFAPRTETFYLQWGDGPVLVLLFALVLVPILPVMVKRKSLWR